MDELQFKLQQLARLLQRQPLALLAVLANADRRLRDPDPHDSLQSHLEAARAQSSSPGRCLGFLNKLLALIQLARTHGHARLKVLCIVVNVGD